MTNKHRLSKTAAAGIAVAPRPGTKSGMVALAVLAICCAATAHAELLDLGGTFQIIGTDAPNTFSESDTLTLGTTSVDGGALNLNVSTASAAGGGEWVIFTFQTKSGDPIAGDLNASWEMQTENVPLASPAVFTAFYLDWGTNGTLTDPTAAINSNVPIETNPVTSSGLVYGEPGSPVTTSYFFTDGFADTFSSFLTPNGFTPSALNEYQAGVLLEPVPVPEPFSLAGLGTGFLGLALSRRRRAQQR